jgi:amino acid transporter
MQLLMDKDTSMKTSTIVSIVVIIVIVLGGWYWYSQQNSSAQPSTNAGLNGSPNQGNLGGTDTGTPQQPAGTNDGTSVSQNLALGVSSDATLGQYL